MDTTRGMNGSGSSKNPPIAVLLGVVCYGGGWIFFSLLQITSTVQGVLGLLNIGTAILPGMTAHDAIAFVNGNMDKYNMIATAIGWGVQLYILMVAFPGNHAAPLHLSKGKKYVTIFLIAADVLTDFLYVVSGHNIFPTTVLGIIPTSVGVNAPGVILVGIIYPIVVCAVTIWCGREFINNLHDLFDLIVSLGKH